MKKSGMVIHNRTLWLNIGNAFIDVAAKSILENLGFRVIDRTYPSLVYGNVVFSLETSIPIVKRYVRRKLYNMLLDRINSETFIDVLDMISEGKIKYVTFAGMVLVPRFLHYFMPVLKKAKKEGVKIVFLGAGGNRYDAREVEEVSQILSTFNPYILVTRDTIAYKHYKDFATHSLNGVDLAVFTSMLSRVDKEFIINKKRYIVMAFDRTSVPREVVSEIERCYNNEYEVVITHHSFHGDINVKKIINDVKNPSYKIFVSDNYKDYIILYANTAMTYTDRVHSCIATLSFGSPCKFYYGTNRLSVIERIVCKKINIGEKIDPPDYQSIKQEYEKLVTFLEQYL